MICTGKLAASRQFNLAHKTTKAVLNVTEMKEMKQELLCKNKISKNKQLRER